MVEVDLGVLCAAIAVAVVAHLAITRWLLKPNLASPKLKPNLASPKLAPPVPPILLRPPAAPSTAALDDPSDPSDPSYPTNPTTGAATPTLAKQAVLREGWAAKESGRVKTWKRRYYVLRTRKSTPAAQLDQIPMAAAHVLLYYKSAEQAHHVGSPPIGVIPIHAPGGDTAVAVVVRKNKPCVRILSAGPTDRPAPAPTPDRPHFMLPEGGVADSQAWMEALTIHNTTPPAPDGDDTAASTPATGISVSGGVARGGDGGGLGPSDQAIMENLTRGSRAAWVPEKNVKICMICSVSQFTMRRRKHHCRNCGKVVCGPCSTFKAVLDRIKPERVCKTCYGLLDTKASKVSGDISDCSGSDDDEYFHVEHVSIGAANAVKAERAEATVAVEATMITGADAGPGAATSAGTVVEAPPTPVTFAGRWGPVLTESLKASMSLRTDAGAEEFDVVINDPAMRVSRATGVLGGVKIDKNKTEATFAGITAKELCDYFYSLDRKLDWEMVVESVALIEDGNESLKATVYHLKMKRTWPAAQRECALITQLHKIGDGQWLAHSDTVEHADFARSPKDLRVKSAMFATTVISDGAVPPYGRADVKCQVEYFAQVNPGGFAPPSVVSAVSRREFPKTLKSLRHNSALWFADKPVDNN